MHETNIEILKDEAIRLIELEIDLLNKMINEPNLLSEGNDGEPQTLDRKSANKLVEVLNGENNKLNSLEMVVAVVGTMKAGKSTAINAIVGTEILPNRNQPMTALPTLIRHTPNQIKPVLHFCNSLPVDNLIKSLQHEIGKCENKQIIQLIERENDIKCLIERIKQGEKLESRYEGSDAIYGFLKKLNDLVRLSRELDIEFPFESYDEINELPVIEVEFVHLRETEHACGRLTLLDTPGPNESGQPHLRQMLRDQLNKASAIFAIFDYTQLKSEADAQVRDDIKNVSEIAKGRCYALVNKFDQKDCNGMDEAEVKAFIASTLMEGAIREDNVFPVSSRFAYLANRARHELFACGQLPELDKNPWVADFGEEAFGRRWESRIGDPDAVKEHAGLLWQDSFFQEPMEKVIKAAHSFAAVYTLDAAAAKLLDTAEKMQNLCNTRETAMKKSVEELQKYISEIQNDINLAEKSQYNAEKFVETTMKNVSDGFMKLLKEKKDQASKAIDEYFEDGRARKRQVLEENKERCKLSVGKSVSLFGKNSQNIQINEKYNESDFDPNSPELSYDNKKDADYLVGKIRQEVNQIYKDLGETIKKELDNAVHNVEMEVKDKIQNDISLLVDNLKSRLGNYGFELNLNTPKTDALTVNFSANEVLSAAIENQKRTESRKREQDGFFGKCKRGLGSIFGNDDWGYESYDVEVTQYTVNINVVKENVYKSMNNNFDSIVQTVTTSVKNPLEKAIKIYFAEYKVIIEQIRNDLIQALTDKKKTDQEQKEFLNRITALRKDLPDCLADSRGLKEQMDSLLKATD